MTKPTAIVVCGDGINCEAETAYALGVVGFSAELVHVSDLLSQPDKLQSAHLFCIPGGFSFGDEIASGKVLALKIRSRMYEELQRFISARKLVLGICNGFQVLVQLGLLPLPEEGAPRLVSLTHNRQKKFLNRWVTLEVAQAQSSSVFFRSLSIIDLPMRHGEGNLKLEVDFTNQSVLETAQDLVKAHATLRYCEDVTGSFDNIAALSNVSGTVTGLMPHPEGFIRFTQHPRWTNRDWLDAPKVAPAGLVIFQNAFDYVNQAN